MEMMNNPYNNKVAGMGAQPAQPVQQPNYGYNYPAYPTYPGTSQPMSTMQQPMSTIPQPTLPPKPSGNFIPPQGQVLQTGVNVPGLLPIEESYIENILRLNLGKMITIYMTYENNSEWNAKIFKGILEAAGRDHIIISDPKTGMRFLLLMVNFDYATFDEELKYSPSFGGGGMASR
ncbi:Spore coat protein GerQ [compost metagenome]